MSIQVVSDIHLETPKGYGNFHISPEAPYLALLGNIGHVHDPGYLDFLETQLMQFRRVFHVLGSQEPYGASWDTTIAMMRRFQEENRKQREDQGAVGLGEYVLLDRERYDLPDLKVTILGCTLFSIITWEEMMDGGERLEDFYKIEDWTWVHHNYSHGRDVQWLNTCVAMLSQDPERKIVIFTHHSPTVSSEAVDLGHVNIPITAGSSTDLQGQKCWESTSVKVWAFGHTHFNCDFTDEMTGKRICTNQRGYDFVQLEGFSEGAVLHLDQL